MKIKLRMPSEDAFWAMGEAVGVIAVSGGLWQLMGPPWASIFFGAVLIYLADARARRLGNTKGSD